MMPPSPAALRNIDPDDLVLCDCAQCGAVMLGESMLSWYKGLDTVQRGTVPPMMGGRRRGRPYCVTCLKIHKAHEAYTGR